MAGACGGEAPGTPGVLALEGITVVEPARGERLPDRTVLVRAGRIEAVAPAGELDVPDGARRLDGAGRYVIPGLWDAHVHVHHDPASHPLYLANGVTAARGMGAPPDSVLPLRDSIRSGRRLGPRLLVSGPVVDGPKEGAPWRLTVENPEEARAAVDSLTRIRVDWIKHHNGVPPVAYPALADAARSSGVPFGGHVPYGTSVREAISAGIQSQEHTTALLEVAMPDEAVQAARRADADALGDALDDWLETEAPRLFSAFVDGGTAFTPTLTAARGAARRDDPFYDPASDSAHAYAPDALRKFWSAFHELTPELPPAVVEGRWMVFEKSVELTRVAHRSGVTLLAGTDVGAPYAIPGFSLHDELELLVEAGLTPMEALRAATVAPARVVGVGDFVGTISEGAAADLVVLDADPTAEIGNTRRIRAVIRGGRLLDRPRLDSVLSTSHRPPE